MSLVLILGLAGRPAGADDPAGQDERAQRDQVRHQQVEVATQLNTLKANDAELEAAVQTLDQNLAAQQSKVADATRNADQAKLTADQLAAELVTSERRVDKLKGRVRERAVYDYVHPSTDSLAQVLHSQDLGEAESRQALNGSVSGTDADVLDQLRAARQQTDRSRARAVDAKAAADQRRSELEAEQQGLQQARDEKAQAVTALQSRISGVQGEANALSAQEDELTAVIQRKQAEYEVAIRAEAARQAETARQAEAARQAKASKDSQAKSDAAKVTAPATTTASPTSAPTTAGSNTAASNTATPTTGAPTTGAPTTGAPTTAAPTTAAPTTGAPQTAPATAAPTAPAPTDPPAPAPTTQAAPAGGSSSSGLIFPADGPITSGFGYRWGSLHPGIDIGAGYGAPIHAAKSGTVIYAGWMDGYGNFVLIDHGAGFVTGYGHQSRIAVSEGQQVSQGQTIGYVGSTGNSTGPHLHFETRPNGVPVDPMQYL